MLRLIARENSMSPRKLDFKHIQVGFRQDQIEFLDNEAKRRSVPRVQVVRDAVDHFRSLLSNGSTNAQVQPIEGPTP
jgi:hypothetical protein